MRKLKWEMVIPKESSLYHVAERFPDQVILNRSSDQLAIAVYWENDFHPSALYFKDIDFGCEVMNELIEIAKTAGKHHLIRSFDEAEQDDISKFEELGFQRFRKTFLTTSKIEKLNSFEKMSSVDFLSKADILKDLDLTKQLLLLSYRNYQTAHLDNPVKIVQLDEWSHLVFNGMIENVVQVIVEDKEIAAYTFLYDDEDNAEIGWCYSREDEKISTLLQKQQYQLASLGFQKLVGEFDTTDFYGMEVMAKLAISEVHKVTHLKYKITGES